jgi:hypothetical protein
VRRSDDGIFELLDEMSVSPPSSQGLIASSDWGRLGASIHFGTTVCLGQQPLKLEMWSAGTFEECAFLSRWSGMFAGLPTSTATPNGTFAYWQQGADCLLDCNGNLYRTSDSVSATAILYDAILRFAYPAAINPITIHAAAVSNSRGTILMPAISGSGKSTLTAALIARGWQYGGDDLVGVGRDPSHAEDLKVLPFPTAIGLKEGSWRLLSSDFPQLESASEVTYNQKRVHFLPIGKEVHIPDSARDRRIVAMVVPCYDPAIECRLTTLSRREAFAATIEAGAGPGNGMNVDSIATLTEVARTVPAYRLRYSDLAQAERCLGALP